MLIFPSIYYIICDMSPTGAPTEVVNVDAHKSRGPVDGVIEPLKTDDIMKNYNRY